MDGNERNAPFPGIFIFPAYADYYLRNQMICPVGDENYGTKGLSGQLAGEAEAFTPGMREVDSLRRSFYIISR
jgi:hypothetical protein